MEQLFVNNYRNKINILKRDVITCIKIVAVNSTIFGNIIKSLSQVAYQNDALGDSMEGIGSLVNSNMVKQISTEGMLKYDQIIEKLIAFI